MFVKTQPSNKSLFKKLLALIGALLVAFILFIGRQMFYVHPESNFPCTIGFIPLNYESALKPITDRKLLQSPKFISDYNNHLSDLMNEGTKCVHSITCFTQQPLYFHFYL